MYEDEENPPMKFDKLTTLLLIVAVALGIGSIAALFVVGNNVDAAIRAQNLILLGNPEGTLHALDENNPDNNWSVQHGAYYGTMAYSFLLQQAKNNPPVGKEAFNRALFNLWLSTMDENVYKAMLDNNEVVPQCMITDMQRNLGKLDTEVQRQGFQFTFFNSKRLFFQKNAAHMVCLYNFNEFTSAAPDWRAVDCAKVCNDSTLPHATTDLNRVVA